MTASAMPQAEAPSRAPLLASLTALEAEVCRLVGQGLPAKAVAHRLGLTIGTVQIYVARVGKKVPGRGPATMRIVMWWRGCSLSQLEGGTHCSGSLAHVPRPVQSTLRREGYIAL